MHDLLSFFISYLPTLALIVLAALLVPWLRKRPALDRYVYPLALMLAIAAIVRLIKGSVFT